MTYGPIDFLALEFQTEKLKGEILPALLELVEKQIVRVIDLVIIQKYEDGHHEAVEMNQLSPDVLAIFDPLHAEVNELIQVEDIDGVAAKMENGTTAAALLFENLWAVKFKESLLRADARLIEQLRVPHEVVVEAMETLAKLK
ncbi:MAG: DUF1269 domain-containing protein [Chloroflexi bacterium]|nr:MAG: DUF1269 domain-containing protein [Chloroflexota bacterium]